MIDLNYYSIVLLVATGLLAGVINVFAGGGSNLTIPALMVMGLPADVANATNRVGVFLQSLVGSASFSQHKKLDFVDLPGVLPPSLLGGGIGAVLAAILPVAVLKPLLLLTLLSISLLTLVRPDTLAPLPGTRPLRVAESRGGFLSLFLAGVYGGFVQAGVGFVLIAALVGILRYDLVRGNALKLVIIGAFSAIALVVFIVAGLIRWLPGLILSLGTVAGAAVGVRLAVQIRPLVLKRIVFAMTCCACLAAAFT